MKLTTLIAAAIALPTALVVAALPAQADDTVTSARPNLCTDHGLSTNSMMFTTSTSMPVTCAYTSNSGRKSIKPGQTTSWSSSSPSGVNAEYKCYGDDGKNITYANSYVGSDATGYTYHVQPTNWNTSTKHYGAAVLWSVADHKGTDIMSNQYEHGCNGDDGRIDAARMYLVSVAMTGATVGTLGVGTPYSIAVDGAKYGGGAPATGNVALMVMKGSKPDKTQDIMLAGGPLTNGAATLTTTWGYKDSSGTSHRLDTGTYSVYAAYQGTGSTSSPVIPSTGWYVMATSALSVVVSAPPTTSAAGSLSVESVTSAVQMRRPAPFSGVMGSSLVQAKTHRGGVLSIACPSGGVPVEINVASSLSRIDVGRVQIADGRLTLRVPAGASTAIQAVCRKASAPKAHLGNLVYGSARDDSFEQSRARALIFAGFGDDRITSTGVGSVADGGVGRDRIRISGIDAVGTGGFGDDVVRSTSSGRSMIIGGAGSDRLVGGPGATFINAQDGRGGDVIVCVSSANVVLLDSGDVTSGPCTIA